MPSPAPDNKDLFTGVPERIANLIVRYYDANLSDEESAELREGLMQHAAARDLFVQWGVQMQTLTESMAPQYSESEDTISLAQLAEMEANAPAKLVNITELCERKQKKQKDPNDLSAQDYVNAGRYALHMLVTSKPAKKFYGRVAVAAALLLAVTLLVVFTRDQPNDSTDAPYAGNPADESNDPSEPGPVGPALSNTVATLTATHDATWAEGASAPGSPLRAGDRLTLTAGFAEITTARGAVAILEAPATIQLINDNALRLHTGKLVGICETDSSKGFLVRTPHLDITDLGTRFGVDASRTGTTEVHVIEGIVEVAPASTTDTTPAQPQRLIAGQALQAKGDADDFVLIETDADRFAAIMPTRIELPGTGQGLALSDTDPNWRVTAIDGKPLDTPGAMAVSTAHDGRYDPPFLPNDPATSQWLLIDKRLGQSGTGPVTFTCQSRFEVPPGVDASAARLIVSFDADDSVTAVRINGHAVAVPDNELEDDSRDLHAMTIRRHLIAGENTIEFDIMDRRSLGFANSGLRVKLSLQADEWKNER